MIMTKFWFIVYFFISKNMQVFNIVDLDREMEKEREKDRKRL